MCITMIREHFSQPFFIARAEEVQEGILFVNLLARNQGTNGIEERPKVRPSQDHATCVYNVEFRTTKRHNGWCQIRIVSMGNDRNGTSMTSLKGLGETPRNRGDGGSTADYVPLML